MEKDKNSTGEKIAPTARREANTKLPAVVPKAPEQHNTASVEETREEKRTDRQRPQRPLPYVDVPPIKSILRPTVDQSVNVNVKELPKEGVAYRNRAPVEAGLDVEKIIDNVLDLEIKLPLRDLAGISAVIQKEIRKQVTKTRQSNDEVKQVHWVAEEEKPLIQVNSLPMSSFMISSEVCDDIPEGYLVANDPVLQYLDANKEAEANTLIVARPSEALRSVFGIINQIRQEECLLDSGSMIVSMSKEAAVQLGLSWDPSIRINMESASNHVEKTLGVARNVCFRIGGLNVFLQVHILEKPPYRVLLGRPFDTFTSSVIKTAADGSSEITLTDPNTQAVTTVPTYPRGIGPEEIQRQQFQSF